jgi:hypothetical protein
METERIGGTEVYRDQPKTVYSWKSEAMIFAQKSRDFYSTVLVFAVLIGIVLFFIEGLMPVLMVAAVVFFIFVSMRRQPDIIENAIREDGLSSGEKSYAWSEVSSYWIEKREGRDVVRVMMRNWPWHLAMVLPQNAKNIDVAHVRKILDDHVPMIVPEMTGTDRFIEWFKKRFPFE